MQAVLDLPEWGWLIRFKVKVEVKAEEKVQMENKRILHGMIEIYENDFMCGYEGEDKKELQIIFLELILYATRYVNNYRYCSRENCPCCPEFNIKAMMKRYSTEINKKLLGGTCGLSEVPLKVMRDFLKKF